MEPLKVHVERIVRPIRASVRRKNTMREELLGHLTRNVESALVNGASEAEALADAIKNLGDPSALRQELQACVPCLERILYTRPPGTDFADAWFDKQPGETAIGFALRRAVFTSISLVVVLAVIEAIHPTTHGLSKCALTVGGLCLLQAVAALIAYYLADVSGLRDVMARTNNSGSMRKGGTLIVFTTAYLLIFLTPALAALWILEPIRIAALAAAFVQDGHWRTLVVGGLILLGALGLTGFAMSKEQRQYERWGSLKIDE